MRYSATRKHVTRGGKTAPEMVCAILQLLTERALSVAEVAETLGISDETTRFWLAGLVKGGELRIAEDIRYRPEGRGLCPRTYTRIR